MACAHMGRYCMENMHYCTLECVHECVRECCHCSFMGCPPVRSLAAVKGGREAFARNTNILAAMVYPWCSCSRPPEVCVVLSSKGC